MYMYIYKDDVVGKEMMGPKLGMKEVEVVMKRFGDEQSTLLDRFERLSFEVQLNQAILGRSFSEPRYNRSPPLSESTVAQGWCHHSYHHRGLGFQKVWKKLFKPIFGRKKVERKEISTISDQKNFKFKKAFSRSVRV